MALPLWVEPVLGLAGDLFKMVTDAIANRKKEAEESRLAAVPRLRALADFLETHEEREEEAARKAVKDATEEVMKEKVANVFVQTTDDV